MIRDSTTMNLSSVYAAHNNYDGLVKNIYDVSQKVHEIFKNQIL